MKYYIPKSFFSLGEVHGIISFTSSYEVLCLQLVVVVVDSVTRYTKNVYSIITVIETHIQH